MNIGLSVPKAYTQWLQDRWLVIGWSAQLLRRYPWTLTWYLTGLRYLDCPNFRTDRDRNMLDRLKSTP